jgi:hypothetical protein
MQLRLEYKLTRGQQNAMAGVLVAIGLVTVYSWAVRPHVAALHAAQQYEWAMNQRVDLGGSISDDIITERRKLDELIVERTAFLQTAFSPTEAAQFHNDLQALCRETGCTVASFGYDDDESVAQGRGQGTASDVVVRSATLLVDGTYGGVVTLLDTLLSHPQRVWIDAFRVTALPWKLDHVACEVTITICVDHAKGRDGP